MMGNHTVYCSRFWRDSNANNSPAAIVRPYHPELETIWPRTTRNDLLHNLAEGF